MTDKRVHSVDSGSLAFLANGGALAELIQNYDWSTTLGPLELWPTSLKTSVGLLVHSPIPIVLLWGEDGIMIYNDAYAQFAGRRHPSLLGSKVREGWPEVADFNDNIMNVVMSGGTLTYTDHQLELDRRGKLEQVWLDLGYSPVIAENGKPGGVIAIVVETTERVLAQRRATSERNRLSELFEQAPSFMALLSGPEHRFELVNPGYRKLVDGRDLIGKTIVEALPEVVEQGYVRLLDEVYKTGEPYTALGAKVALKTSANRLIERFVDFVYQPIATDEQVNGIFVQGVDITERILAERQARTADERLHLATEAAQIGIWDFNPPTSELKWDSRCKALFGLPYDAPVSYEGAFLAGLHPDDKANVHAAVERALMSGAAFDMEYRTIGISDGIERWVSAKGRAIFENGAAVRFVGTVLDISSRKRAERRLEIVNRTGATVAAELDLQKIVQIATDAGVELSGAQFGAFFYNVFDEKGESYMLYTLSGAPRSAFEKFPMPRNTEVFAPTFTGQGVVRSDDIRKDRRYGKNAPRKGMPEGHLPVTSYLAVPVMSRSGEVLGGLFFGHEEAGKFDSDSETLVTAIANQAAVAIDNAQLYSAAREANLKLEAINHSLETRVESEVAARLTAEKSVQSTSEQFRLLVQGVVDYAIYMLDLEGNVTTWNPGAERIKGYTQDEVVGRHFSMFYTEESRSEREPWKLLAQARDEGRTAMEGWRLRKNGSRFWASVVIDAVRNEEGKLIGFAKVTRDITEQREAVKELETAREALFQAQKMESIGQLTGGIAHDFNNMLAVIIGSLNLMQRRLNKGDANVGKYIESATEGALRASTLTKRLLAFSRQQPLEPIPVDANKLVASMSELLTRTLGDHIQVQTVLSPGLWRAFADAVQLESALLNLAVNARDAMPNGGKLTIDTGNALVDSRVAREYALPEGQYVLVAVSDTGSGMSEEVMAQAFDPFFTTKEVGKGSGLGLSQVFGFVRQSGGHVKLYSEVDVGTTVKIYLPRFFGQDEAKNTEGANATLETGECGEVILVVEDEERVRNYSVEALKELGYSVLAAEGPLQALTIIDSGQRIDLLFSDVVMPEMNGRQLAQRAVEKLPHLKVVFTTGYTRNAIVHNGMLDPGIAFLQKPFTIDQLAAKIRQALDT